MLGELPTGDTGDIVPVVLTAINGRMVPSGVNGIAAVDDVAVAVVPGMNVETVPGTVDGTGTGAGVIEGNNGGGGAAGGGTGMVEPGKRVKADVSGCWRMSKVRSQLAVVLMWSVPRKPMASFRSWCPLLTWKASWK